MLEDVEQAIDELKLNGEVKQKVNNEFENLQREDTYNIYGTLIYYHAQQEGTPRTKKLIAEALEINCNDFYNRAYEVADKMDLEIKPVLPEDIVDYICDITGCTEKVTEDTKQIIENMPHARFSGKTPRSVIAGAIHIARFCNNETTTQKELCDTLNISQVTLRNVYKDMIKHMELGDFLSFNSEQIREGLGRGSPVPAK